MRYDNIIVSPEGLTEADGKALVLFVAAADIDHVMVKFGRAEHRPIVSLTVGLLLSSVGIVGVGLLFSGITARLKAGMISFGAIGGSLVFDALKKRYFLEVHHKKGLTRLVFSKNAKAVEIQKLCEEIRTTHQFQIHDGLRG